MVTRPPIIDHLRVVNLGLIGEAALDLTPGFNVITGETGAGKTLMLGGLRLLLGDKADSGLVGGVGDQATVEGMFTDASGDEVAVTRILARGGRSRAYADGVLVSAGALQDLVGPKVEVVGQHDQLTLRRGASVIAMVDAAGGAHVEDRIEVYRRAWEQLEAAERDLEALGGDQMALRRELDLVGYQAEEIEGGHLEVGLDDHLEVEASRLRNLDEITAHLAESARLLEGMVDDAGEVVARTRKVADLDVSSRGLAGQSELLVEAAQDLMRAVLVSMDGLEADPARLEEVEQQLTLIGDLKRKYGRTLEEVIGFGETARKRAGEIERLLGQADGVEAARHRALSAVLTAADALTAARTESAERLVGEAVAHLGDLGLESPALEVRLGRVEPGPFGADRAELWFTSDTRLDMAPVGSGASGGELSRLVLAIRLASRAGTRSLVFDEVDTGLGGATALAMGRKLAQLAGDAQVVCVTHLPQVAAFADRHFVVTREGADARVRAVDGEDRVREISRMLAGLPESLAGHQAATELLSLATEHIHRGQGR